MHKTPPKQGSGAAGTPPRAPAAEALPPLQHNHTAGTLRISNGPRRSHASHAGTDHNDLGVAGGLSKATGVAGGGGAGGAGGSALQERRQERRAGPGAQRHGCQAPSGS